MTAEARKTGAHRAGLAVAKAAAEAYGDLAPMMTAWRAEGMTLQGIAGKLNADGHTTRRGKPWNAVQVGRVLDRAEAGLQANNARV